MVLALFTASTAAAQVTYSGSVRTATGAYLFTERTTSVYVLSAMEADKGPVRVSASVPLIYQSTPWISYAPVPIPSGGSQSARVADEISKAGGGSGSGSGTDQGSGSGSGSGTGSPGGTRALGYATVPAGFVVTLPTDTVTSRTGVGDPILRASYRLTSSYATTAVRVHGAYKPGLASVTQGFGTGASDFGAGLTLAHATGHHQLSGAAEFWRLGDMADLPLNDALSYRLAYDRYLSSNRWWVSGAVAGWTRIVEGIAPPADVSIGLGRAFSATGRSVGVTAAFGLTDSSPDFALSLDWRLKL